LKVKNNYNKN